MSQTNVRDNFKDVSAPFGERYISASLNFMAADTRQGFNGAAQRDFAVICEYAARNLDRTDLADYISRRGPQAMEVEPRSPKPTATA